MVKQELEEKLASLEKSLNEAIGAIRRAAQQSDNTVGVIAKLNDEINRLKGRMVQIEEALKSQKANYSAGISRYE